MRGAGSIRLGAVVAVLLAVARLTPAAGAPTASLRIVVNSESAVTKLTRDDLGRIYLGKRTLWENDTRIVPAMPEEDSTIGNTFLEATLHKSVSQYRAYWKRLLFSGGGAPPRTFRTSQQVLEFVAKQPGAIGVVEPSASDPRVKVVQITE